jgi:hypothetical protein
MMYGQLERRVGRLLDPFPRLRSAAKAAYQRLNYYASPPGARAPFRDPRATLIDAAEMVAGADGLAGTSYFYGYYGICPWSADGRYLLLHRLATEASDVADICVIDTAKGALLKLAHTRAWNLQQGSMAQWLPGDDRDRVCFNDVVDDRLVCRIVSIDGVEGCAALPIQAIHPNGREALSINYRRLARLRPEYGYAHPVVNMSPDQLLHEDGIWWMPLDGGPGRLLISLEELADSLPRQGAQAEHKVNHILYSPSGDRFVFMHRWFASDGKHSRLYCADSATGRARLLLDHRMVSHYAWRDDRTLLAWARAPEDGDRYYLLDVESGERAPLGRGVLDRYGDGHPSFSPDGSWLVTDSYPDRARMRHLLLYHLESARVVEAGRFFAPWRFDGAVRCDLHPRWDRTGNRLSFDSAHDGVRRSYVLDVRKIVQE